MVHPALKTREGICPVRGSLNDPCHDTELEILDTRQDQNFSSTLLFIIIHIIIHYILILKQTLYTINLHINYTLDKYTIHFTYTLFILTIKHILYSLNIIYTLLFITIHIIIY